MLVLMAFALQKGLDNSATMAGLKLAVIPDVLGLVAPLGISCGERFSSRRVGTAGMALCLAAVAASFNLPALAAWVPVATTAGTSLVAYIAASRYDHLIIEYLRTAQRLEDLRNGRADSPTASPDLIDACEAAISSENQGWMARWATEDIDNPPTT